MRVSRRVREHLEAVVLRLRGVLRHLEGAGFVPRRIVQGKDGTLLVVTADVITPYNAAQSLKSPNGKVLRINTDGSIPKDNPFVSNKDADPSVYILGVRDPQGMAFNSNGDLYIIENEPRGGDELNHPQPGKNYGWPVITYGVDYSGARIGEGTAKAGMEQPVFYWDPVIAPSGMIFYTADAYRMFINEIIYTLTH